MTEKAKGIIKFEDGELAEFAANGLLAIVESAAATSVNGNFGIAVSSAHLIKNARGAVKLKNLINDLLRLKKNSFVSEESLKSDRTQDDLLELMDALEKENLTEDRFSIMRKIFLQSAINTKENANHILEREFIIQSRKLESSEIHLIGSIWNNGNDSWIGNMKYETPGMRAISENTGLPTEICKIYLSKLTDKAFLKIESNPGYTWTCQLTTFGKSFCEHIGKFNQMEKVYFAQ